MHEKSSELIRPYQLLYPHGSIKPIEQFGASPTAPANQNQLAIQEAIDNGGLLSLTTQGVYRVNGDTFSTNANTKIILGPNITFSVGGVVTTMTTLQSLFSGPSSFSELRILPQSSGLLQIGTSTQTAAGELFNYTNLNRNTPAYVRPVDMYMESGINPQSSGAGAADFHLIDAKLYGGGSNTNITSSTRMYCTENQVQYTGSTGRTLGQGVSVYNNTRITAAGTMTEGVACQNIIQNSSTGTITTGIGVQVKSAVNSGGGTIATNIGINVEDQTVGSTNYALKTNQGQVTFFSGTAVPAGGTAGVGIQMSSTSGLGIYFGSGVPTLSAAQGSLYMRTDGSSTSTRAYVNTNGTTGWTAITTAS